MSFRKAAQQQEEGSNALLPSPAFPLQLFLMNSSSGSLSSCTEQGFRLQAASQELLQLSAEMSQLGQGVTGKGRAQGWL